MNARYSVILQMVLAALLLPTVTAQDSSDEAATEIQQKVEKHAKALEAWAKQHEKEFEGWAERHAGKWEDWAKRFETHWESWAEQQEEVWEKWATKYEARWKEWSQDLENEEMDPEVIGEIIERNMEMLGEMPIGQLIEQAMKHGAEGMKDAPWESLGELQGIIKESIEQSLNQLEETEAKGSAQREDLERSAAKLRGAIEKIQTGMDSKRAKMSQDAASQLEALKKQLAVQRLSAERSQQEAIVSQKKAMEALERAKTSRDTDLRKRMAAEREVATKRKKELERIRAELAGKKESEEEDEDEDADDSREARVRQVVEEIAAERSRIRGKDDELAALRDEIRALRKQLEKLKDSKKDK